MPSDLAVDEDAAEQVDPSDPAPTFMHRRPEPKPEPEPEAAVARREDPCPDHPRRCARRSRQTTRSIEVEDPVSALLLRATAEHLQSKKDAIAPLLRTE